MRHLAFCVDSVEQTVKKLEKVGISCQPIRVDDYTGKQITFLPCSEQIAAGTKRVVK